MSNDNNDRSYLPEWAADIKSLMADEEGLENSLVTLEFPDDSDKLTVSRRDFLRVASVAAASAGLVTAGTGCEVNVEKVVPYAKRPTDVYFVAPNSYTTVTPSGVGMLMKVREGRITKLEGNPRHPTSLGALSAREQGAVLDLYSPDRAFTPLKPGRKVSGKVEALSERTKDHLAPFDAAKTTWAELDGAVSGALKGAKKVRILTGERTGPAEKALLDDVMGLFPDAKQVIWEPVTPQADSPGWAAAYGAGVVPRMRFDRARAVVSLGDAFLEGDQGTEHSTQFANTRVVPETIDKAQGDALAKDPAKAAQLISRLTMFEGRLSITGAAADIRHRVRPSDLVYVGLAIAHDLLLGGKVKSPLASDTNVRAALQPFTPAKVAGDVGLDAKAITDAAASLASAGRFGLITGRRAGMVPHGDTLDAVCMLINEALGSVGVTVEVLPSGAQSAKVTRGWAGLKALTAELNSGSVDVLIIAYSNPAYATPPGLKFAEAMSKAKLSVVIDTQLTETGALADWVAAGHHYLESWGDATPHPGVHAVRQPGLQPVCDSRAFEDSLMVWTRDMPGSIGSRLDKALADAAAYQDELDRPSPGAWHFYVRNYWEEAIFPATKRPLGFEAFWTTVLREGVYLSPAPAARRPRFNTAKAFATAPKARKAPGAMEVELFASPILHDGRQASNGALQECADPITQVTWGNYVALAPKKFVEMGLKPGDVLSVKTASGAIELPALSLPGLPESVVAVPLGYGRTHAGVVGSGIGADGFKLAADTATGPQYAGLTVEVSATGKFDQLGIPEGKGHIVDLHDRPIVPLTTLPEYIKDQGAGIHMHNMPGMWPKHEYAELKWGMAIDLSRCTGCAACVVACQVENNVPVVGKQGVIEGRAMHWMRIDRYFQIPEGTPHDKLEEALLTQNPQVAAAEYLTNPVVLMEPMLCQHCDNAPCETVCPVLATVHSSDGLNEQVYNRCVGTRYCANNCPYKVRRFNWYNYSADRSEEFFADVFPELKSHAVLNVAWPLPLRFNPEVTVRTRGVMEKCSFCVQRLKRGTRSARKLGINSPEAEIQTACQQTCPAQAITFGNVRNPRTAIAKKMASKRNFKVLEHLGVEPAVRYLTRVRNVEYTPPADGGAKKGH